MENTIIGMILGALFRLAPELMMYVDRQLDRWHELRMQQVQLDFYKHSEYRPEMLPGPMMDLSMLSNAVNKQMKSESKWSPYVRPVVTYCLLVMYSVPLLLEWRDYSTTSDLTMLAGVLNFWFLDRVIKNR